MTHPHFEKIKAIQNGYKAKRVNASHLDNHFADISQGLIPTGTNAYAILCKWDHTMYIVLQLAFLKLRSMFLQFSVSVNIDLHYLHHPFYWLIIIFSK